MIDFGIAASSFRSDYLDRKPHLRRTALSEPGFSWADVDDVLHRVEPAAPIFQLFNAGTVPEERYTERYLKAGRPQVRLNKRRFYAEIRNGATLVLNRFEDYSLRGRRLCTEVSRFAGRHAIGNAYLSVGGNGTFGQHWDTHDVFAIQLFGRKRWRVYQPTFSLPLAMHGSETSAHPCPKDPLMDCVLAPGDVLYLPRGWWHEAIPLDEPSLHLSVGTYAASVHDYLSWACARFLPEIEASRQTFDDGGDLETALEGLRRIALDPATRAAFQREIAGREEVATEFDSELFLLTGPNGLTDDTRLTLSGYRTPEVSDDALVINGSTLKLNSTCRDIIAALQAESETTLAQLRSTLQRCDEATLRLAVLELAQHDIVTITRD